MKKRYLLGALGLVLLGLGTSACSSQTNNSGSKQTIVAANKQLLVSQRSLSKRPMKTVVKVQNALEKI